MARRARLPGAYTLSLLRPEIIRDLELERHGLHVDVHEPYLFAPFPDGRQVVTWSSRERTHDGLERDWSRADADGYAAFAERWERAAERARPLMSEPPDRERWLDAVGAGILDGSVADELRGIPSEQVRVPFALQGLIGTLAGPDDPGTAFVGFYHDLGEAAGVPGAWGYARGGMGAVTAALRAAAEGGGGGGAARGAGRARACRGWARRGRGARGRARSCTHAACFQTPTRCARRGWREWTLLRAGARPARW